MHTKFQSGNLKIRDHSGDLVIDKTMILTEIGYKGMD
jgi:hypothetical protein